MMACYILLSERQARDGTMTIDSNKPVRGSCPGQLTSLNAGGSIFIGGVPNYLGMTGSNKIRGFDGCLISLQVNGIPVSVVQQAIKGRNIDECS